MKHKYPHVVYIITKLELGGAQKVCLTLFKELQQTTGTSLISGKHGYLASDVQKLPNTILLDTFTREVGIQSFIQEIKLFKQLVATLKKLKQQHPDIMVHTHSTKAGIIGRWAAWWADIPHRVHTIHGYAFHTYQPWYIRAAIIAIEWVTSLITTHFICVSLQDARTGTRLFKGFEHKHSIIRAAVDWQQFYIPARDARQFPTQKTPFIFGTVACFKPQKNLFDLLQAFLWAYQHNDTLRLEIIGDGQQRPFIEAWIHKHHLQQVITLHGWQEKVAPIMSSWHAFVLSSLWEGLPCAIVEARLLKLPVLSYMTGGINDVIMHNENGLLFTPYDWRALAEAMVEVSQDSHLYQRLSTHPDQLDDFRDTQMVQQHLKLYYDLHHQL